MPRRWKELVSYLRTTSKLYNPNITNDIRILRIIRKLLKIIIQILILLFVIIIKKEKLEDEYQNMKYRII